MIINGLYDVVAQAADEELAPMPIDRAWIVAGTPDATASLPLASADGACAAGVWHCTPGEFDWHYTWDEFSLFLSGRAVLREPGGTETVVNAGDLVAFRKGTTVRWRVEEAVKKAFVLYQSPPPPDQPGADDG